MQRRRGMEDTMLTALILVCSIAITPDLADCNPATARIVMRTPESYASPVPGPMHGQAYLAETAVEHAVNETDRVKVVCIRAKEADDTIERLERR
jgi:hypothetical protein